MCGIHLDYHQPFPIIFLNENLTQNILVRKNKVHLDYNDIHFKHTYILDIIIKHDKLSPNYKKGTKAVPQNRQCRLQGLKTYIFFW